MFRGFENEKTLDEYRSGDLLTLLGLPTDAYIMSSYLAIRGLLPDIVQFDDVFVKLLHGYGRLNWLSDFFRELNDSEIFDKEKTGIDDDQFIEILYWRYLGRNPDPSGKEHFLAFVHGGDSRERVRDRVADSDEARLNTTLWQQLSRWAKEYEKPIQPRWNISGRTKYIASETNIALEIMCSNRASMRDSLYHEAHHQAHAAEPSAHASPIEAVVFRTDNVQEMEHQVLQAEIDRVNPRTLGPTGRGILNRLRIASNMVSMKGSR